MGGKRSAAILPNVISRRLSTIWYADQKRALPPQVQRYLGATALATEAPEWGPNALVLGLLEPDERGDGEECAGCRHFRSRDGRPDE